jgi:diguanylate cyclase (GGDEF)-like protein
MYSLLRNIAQEENMFVQSNASLRNLIQLMLINQKGAIAILEDKQPVGILTEKDIVEILYRGIDLDERADKYARKLLITTKGDRTIGYALNLMIENNIRRVIVTDDSNNFLGLITQKDLIKQLEDDFYRSNFKVKHITENLRYMISAPIECTLCEVLIEMAENKVSSVPVTKDGEAVGIITEKDILKIAAGNISLENNVGEYMSKPLISVNPDTDLTDIVKTMSRHDIRRVVVTNNEGIATNVVTIRDVLKNIENDYSEFLERKLKHAKDILHLLPEMLIEVTDTGKEHLMIWANEKVINTFGREIIDRPINELIPHENWDEIYNALLKSNKVENVKFRNNSKVYELSGFSVRTDGKFENSRFQLILRDITEEVKLSTTDHLTTIYNRRFINEFLKKEIERSRRLDKIFSIVICDIDDFKRINDTYGHLSGDMVLKSFSQLIINDLRKLDVVGRYGGDEFMIILPETTSENAFKIVERLRIKLDNMEIPVMRDKKIKITASFGIATYPEDGMSIDYLMVTGDSRLYEAKNKGKNKIVC